MSGDYLRSSREGSLCNLIPLGPQHTDSVVRWRNDPAIAKFFSTEHVFEASAHEAWLKRTLASNTDFNWVIEALDGKPVGTIGIYNVDWPSRQGEFGRLLIGEPAARSRGFAKAATHMCLAAAAAAGLRRLCLEVLTLNAAAYNLYRQVGFVEQSRQPTIISMSVDLTP